MLQIALLAVVLVGVPTAGEIECAFAVRRGVEHDVAVARALLARIEEDQWSLRHEVGDTAFAASEDPAALAEAFLAEGDRGLESLAWSYLLNHDGWMARATLREKLLSLLADDATDDETRADIVWLFFRKDAGGDVRDVALHLARDHSRPNLAHRMAAALVHSHENDPEALAKFLVSDARALREEALTNTRFCEERSAAALLAIATDRSEPPRVRGEAIAALTPCADDPAFEAALVQLLDRKHWFFGAVGNHFLIHSLALVIPALETMQRPRLEALRAELASLPEEERGYVEWVLDNALRE